MEAHGAYTCVIKLGGAAITDKDRIEELKPKAFLRDLADIIAILHKKHIGLIIVHGAGSFGHFQAKKHQFHLSEGGQSGKTPVELLRGVAETRQSVLKLNAIIVDMLLEAGVPAVGMAPMGSWSMGGKKGVVVSDNISQLAQALGCGFVPVLHGDIVLQHSPDRVAILSGDAIMRRIAEACSLARAVFVTNVPGVLSSWPCGELIREIHVDARGSLLEARNAQGQSIARLEAVGSSSVIDTTGGMITKLYEAFQMAAGGTKVRMVEAGSMHLLAAVERDVLPADWVGTEIICC
jgi:isopentenyl phosphate kinase